MRMRRPLHLLAVVLVMAGSWQGLLGQEDETKPKTPAPKAKRAEKPASVKGVPEAALPRTKGKLKPVDINHATKEEISFMLGIDVSIAAKIVAGRPYLTKANLLTNKVVSKEVYASIKSRVVAKQGPAK